MYEFLSKLFGKNEKGEPEALTFEQLEAKIKENKDLKLANLAEGGYVSKEKFEAKDLEAKTLKGQLDTANETINSYKDMDVDSIKKSAADWENKYNTEKQNLEQKLIAQERKFATDMFFKDYKFSSKAAEAGIRAEFDSKDFKLDGGKFLGAEDYMKNLMSEDDYKAAFVAETPAPDPKPDIPAPKFTQTTPQPQPRKSKSLAELMRFKNENPNATIDYGSFDDSGK